MKILHKNNLASIDPVCGLEVDHVKSNLIKVVRGHTYYFCTEKCCNEFNEDPTKYLDIFNITKKRKNWWGRYLERV